MNSAISLKDPEGARAAEPHVGYPENITLRQHEYVEIPPAPHINHVDPYTDGDLLQRLVDKGLHSHTARDWVTMARTDKRVALTMARFLGLTA